MSYTSDFTGRQLNEVVDLVVRWVEGTLSEEEKGVFIANIAIMSKADIEKAFANVFAQLALKADKTQVEQLRTFVNEVTERLEAAVALKADKTALKSLEDKVSEVESTHAEDVQKIEEEVNGKLEAFAQEVVNILGTKADYSDLENLAYTIEQVLNEIYSAFGEINGVLEQQDNTIGQLTSEIARLSKTYAFGGVATPSTNVGTPTTNTFYIATEAGTYTNMGGVVLNASEFAVISWNGSAWSKHTIFDVLSLPDAEGADPQTLVSIVVDGNQLKQVKLASMLSYAEDEVAYGVEWDVTVSTTAMTRIGNMSLHRSLPIQKKMKGCLLDDVGNVVEYLPSDDWTGATLDGSKGQVMVEIPMHYRKFETIGNIRRCWVSEYPVSGYHKVPKMYISAYEATVQRSTSKLASVMNTSTDYRGGNNNSSWDGTYRSLLCRPATTISRTDFRAYARKRKPTTAEWNCQDYNAYKAVFWLYYLEYANRNCQLDFNGAKDSNGYAQGGLGKGVSTMLDSDWGSYNSYCPFVPCGHTNKLGNGSGEVAYVVKKEDGSTLATVYANRYRGIEHPFGHLWKWTDGINIQINPTSANGGDNTSKVYVADDPAAYNDSNYDGYTMRGLEARLEGYVKELVFGEFGDIMPATVGGSSTTYWADYHVTKIPTATELRAVQFGGNAPDGAIAGIGSSRSVNPPSAAGAARTSRLCFIPKK